MSIDELKAYYEEYDRAYLKAVMKAPPLSGAFGIGDELKSAPCHEIFYEKVENWAAEFVKTRPEPQAAAQALDVILKAAANRRGQGTYWYCYAAQGHGIGLVEWLTAEDAAAVLSWYEAEYPPIDRMPVQQKLCKELKKQAKPGFTLFGRGR